MKTLKEIRETASYKSTHTKCEATGKSRPIVNDQLDAIRNIYFLGHFLGQPNTGEEVGLEKLCRAQAYYDYNRSL